MQRKINDGENPKILATQSTQNKTETNSSKKQTPTMILVSLLPKKNMK
jgi:hypothetical protein